VDHVKAEISPLDGRYYRRIGHLSDYFSEFALARSRCLVELKYIEALDETGLFPALAKREKQKLEKAKETFTEDDFARIKAIEDRVNQDVKSCELFLRESLQLDNPNLIHFGLTSEDVNNLVYNRLFDTFRTDQQLPLLKRLLVRLCKMVEEWCAVPFPARTHGQAASPTTAGKELAVFLSRLLRQYNALRQFRFRGKLNGATGNYSALMAAFPEHDWIAFSRRFVEALGFDANPCTTQIEDHDTWSAYFDLTKRINCIVLDLDRDLWAYISREWFRLKPQTDEVSSSTMPHKVSPINFENSEGNLLLSNALLSTLADNLTQSRMQRDLSDSTMTRNVGVALVHAHLAVMETLRGLEKLALDETAILRDLEDTPEVLAEAYQTILRTTDIDDPYELLKEQTRGRKVSLEDLHRFVDGLDVSDAVKGKLKGLRVRDYVGDAAKICGLVIEEARKELEE